MSKWADEADFHAAVKKWLEEKYGAMATIEHEPSLRTRREPDFIIRTPLVTIVVEVEDTADDAIAGAGQALLYAAHNPEFVPVVVFPASADDLKDNIEELALLRQWMPIIALSP